MTEPLISERRAASSNLRTPVLVSHGQTDEICGGTLLIRVTDYLFHSSAYTYSSVVNELPHRLAALARQWREDTRFTSSMTEMVTHPAYQRIIGEGRAAVPFLLEELQREPDHWFWALRAITGANPVPDEDAGNLERMRGAWLQWGKRSGYIS